MTLATAAAISQIAAAVGVITSVLYLAKQINDQNSDRRRSAVNILVGQWSAIVKSLVENEDFCDLYLRGLKSFGQLRPTERIRLGVFLGMLFKNYDEMYHYHLDGTLGRSHWDVIERMLADMIACPGIREWWSVRHDWHTKEFSMLVDRIVSKGSISTAYDRFVDTVSDDHETGQSE
jgi:hypothetical protein